MQSSPLNHSTSVDTLKKRKVLLGITGGIAAYKCANLVRELVQADYEVQVVMTQAATQFITPLTMQALSGLPVFVDAWDHRIDNHMPHIDLSRDADLILIAPASADFIAKLAHGHADDLLSTLCLARTIPLMIAPAMNQAMWHNAAVQRNIKQLQADGVLQVGPEAGSQACGETGLGRMTESQMLFDAIEAFYVPKVLQGKKVLITAGATFEPIDPVRGITNLSSGKMGYALARAAAEAGAEVCLVSGSTNLPCPAGVERIDVLTALQMYDAVHERVVGHDVFIAVAAVADWRVDHVQTQKIKKTDQQHVPTLNFVQNPDLLASVAKLANPPFCVGFAAESEQLAHYAQVKRQAKNIPLLFANLVQQALGNDENEVLMCDALGETWLPKQDKLNLARQMIGEIAKRVSR